MCQQRLRELLFVVVVMEAAAAQGRRRSNQEAPAVAIVLLAMPLLAAAMVRVAVAAPLQLLLRRCLMRSAVDCFRAILPAVGRGRVAMDRMQPSTQVPHRQECTG